MKIISVVGRKNTGKTTLIERMIPILRDRGLRVAVIKHDAHDFSIDLEGKDTWRFRQAGATEVVIASSSQLALMRRLEAPVCPEEILSLLDAPDLVILEGYKRMHYPKLVVLRDAVELDEMHLRSDPTIIGHILRRFPNAAPPDSRIPQFWADDIERIADFVRSKAMPSPEKIRIRVSAGQCQ